MGAIASVSTLELRQAIEIGEGVSLCFRSAVRDIFDLAATRARAKVKTLASTGWHRKACHTPDSRERRLMAPLIYRRTKSRRAVQLLLGHSKLESTVGYLGIEVDDALEISEQTEI